MVYNEWVFLVMPVKMRFQNCTFLEASIAVRDAISISIQHLDRSGFSKTGFISSLHLKLPLAFYVGLDNITVFIFKVGTDLLTWQIPLNSEHK